MKRYGIDSRLNESLNRPDVFSKRDNLALCGLDPIDADSLVLSGTEEIRVILLSGATIDEIDAAQKIIKKWAWPLLEYEVFSEEPWIPLCTFLNLPLARFPFPKNIPPDEFVASLKTRSKRKLRQSRNAIKRYLTPYTLRLRRWLTMVDARKAATSIRESSITPPCFETPLFRNERRDPMASFLPRKKYCAKKYYIAEGKNWIWEPKTGAVMDSRRRYVIQSTKLRLTNTHIDAAGRRNEPDIRISGTASTFQYFFRNYYHTLVDNLPKLYQLRHALQSEDLPLKLAVMSPLNDVEAYYLPKMLPEGVEILEFPENVSLVEFNRLLFVPPFSNYYNGALPAEYIRYFRELVNYKDQLKSGSEKRLYVSRRADEKGGRRCIYNEDELWRRLEPLGFSFCLLEELSFQEQADLFRSAEIVVGPHGAGLTNILFSESIHVVELFPAHHVIPYYYYMAKSLGFRYACFFGDAQRHHDNFHVDVDEVIAAVKGALTK